MATCFVGEDGYRFEASGEAMDEAANALLSNNLSLGEAELLRRRSICGGGGGLIIFSTASRGCCEH